MFAVRNKAFLVISKLQVVCLATLADESLDAFLILVGKWCTMKNKLQLLVVQEDQVEVCQGLP